MKQRAINPDNLAKLTTQLKLWQEQELFRPIDSKWNLALLSIAQSNMAAERVIIDLRLLNTKYRNVNLYISKVEHNLQKLHSTEIVIASNMSNGIGVIPIAEKYQHYPAFMTPNQTSWTFKRLPNKWVNSPAY